MFTVRSTWLAPGLVLLLALGGLGGAAQSGDGAVQLADGHAFRQAEVVAVVQDRAVSYEPRESQPRAADARPTVPVYRQIDVPDSVEHERYGLPEIVIKAALEPDAAALGLHGVRPAGVAGYWLGTLADAFEAPSEAARVAASPGVDDAWPLTSRLHHARLAPGDPLYPNQWHLSNTGQGGGVPGIDVNIEAAWDSVNGSNVVIAVIDDGLQHTHPDLDEHYVAAVSRNYCDAGTDDPAPTSSGQRHGTAVAGVAAGNGGNGLGIVGAAFNASLAGQKLIACANSDADEAGALGLFDDTIDIYTNSWGPSDSGTVTTGPGPLARAAIADNIATGRGGLGSIYLWAGGNGHADSDNGNYDGYANNRHVIAVGAIDNEGDPAWYSEACACLLVSAPSSGGTRGIVTTDLVGAAGYDSGDYTCNDGQSTCFGGTSSATPLVAGVVALMLEANPALSWREVMMILAETATRDGLDATGWTTNAAGWMVHPRYGFGMVDAGAAVAAAQTWTRDTRLEPESSTSATWSDGVAIPDGTGNFPAAGEAVSVDIEILGDVSIERAELTFSATHTWENDLRLRLTSPGGTVSELLPGRPGNAGENYSDWTVTSTHFYGESSAGTWTLTVDDMAAQDVGTLDEFTLTLYGTTIAPPLIEGSCTLPQEGEPCRRGVLCTLIEALPEVATLESKSSEGPCRIYALTHPGHIRLRIGTEAPAGSEIVGYCRDTVVGEVRVSLMPVGP